ncbi:hypothetical protein Pyn_28330 [Prunus yedoensis var. nudiflora]|uniref:Uncharacterized protein n=1 Tax=Prunus yedoensis var. nudiflora TaxID=2094558 RepID=A0A314ZQP2_PRUYE|nr:hypothetical protein Pyn_28330 [Prunus yedoensis var. nudiflora]
MVVAELVDKHLLELSELVFDEGLKSGLGSGEAVASSVVMVSWVSWSWVSGGLVNVHGDVVGLGSWMVAFLEPMVSSGTRMMGHKGSCATKRTD